MAEITHLSRVSLNRTEGVTYNHERQSRVALAMKSLVNFRDFIVANQEAFAKICVVYLIFIFIGFSLGIPGPSMLDLGLKLNASLDEIAVIIPARAGGYAVGAILGKCG